MSNTTLTIVLIVALFAIIIATRADKRVSSKTQAVRERVARIAGKQSAPESESLPRVSRNRWERRDLSRMLMTEDEYLGQITEPR